MGLLPKWCVCVPYAATSQSALLPYDAAVGSHVCFTGVVGAVVPAGEIPIATYFGLRPASIEAGEHESFSACSWSVLPI